MSYTNESVEQIKRYINSYSGIDGGNQSAKIWICGIEYGGEVDKPEDIGELTPITRDGIRAWDEKFKGEAWWAMRGKWVYHGRISKLMLYMMQDVMAKAVDVTSFWKSYRDNFLYAEDGNEFKLNLFPFSCPNEHAWGQCGFDKKSNYLVFCRNGENGESRFGKLHSLCKELKPKVIIATGKTYCEDFQKAFGFEGDMKSCSLEVEGPQRNFLYKKDEGGTALVVLPFPTGPQGLNKDAHLKVAARQIVKISGLNMDDFPRSL